MAYDHGQYQVIFPSGMSVTASGDQFAWTPGYMPHIVRAVGVVFTASGIVTSGLVLAFTKNTMVSGGPASSDVAVLTGPSGTAALLSGSVLYKDGLNNKVTPGQKVTINVRAAVTGTTQRARAFLWVEPTWETPANNTTMVASS